LAGAALEGELVTAIDGAGRGVSTCILELSADAMGVRS
jgi:hypothetical protein